MARPNKNELDKLLDDLAKRTIEREKDNEDFIHELYSYFVYDEFGDDYSDPTSEVKVEKLKDYVETNRGYSNTVLEEAENYGIKIFKKGEFPLVKLSSKKLHEYMEKGVKIKHLKETEIDIEDDDNDCKNSKTSLVEILKEMPKGANAYRERIRSEYWERNEQFTSSGYSKVSQIDYYQIDPKQLKDNI